MKSETDLKSAFGNLRPECAPFNAKTFRTTLGHGWTPRTYCKNEVIFSQGDSAQAVYYILGGSVKLTVLSSAGKEAVTGMLRVGEFFGEACLSSQTQRTMTASSLEKSEIVRLEKGIMPSLLAAEPAFSSEFMWHLLSRNIRIEEDLVDQLFNSAEKRLARTLLLLADYGTEKQTETVMPKISQQVLAEMIGTTRSRVSFFMNKFRRLGYIHYNPGLSVHRTLLKVVLCD
jgi:CRP/FNR family cyclic AMP-dependent transcriptional regulator